VLRERRWQGSEREVWCGRAKFSQSCNMRGVGLGKGLGGLEVLVVVRLSMVVVPCTIGMSIISIFSPPRQFPCWLASGATVVFERPKLLLWEE
jgi:hypothetical protein